MPEITYAMSDKRKNWTPHTQDIFYVQHLPLHYCVLQFFCPEKCVYVITGMYKLFPMHSKILAISQSDHTIMAVSDLLIKNIVRGNQVSVGAGELGKFVSVVVKEEN